MLPGQVHVSSYTYKTINSICFLEAQIVFHEFAATVVYQTFNSLTHYLTCGKKK